MCARRFGPLADQHRQAVIKFFNGDSFFEGSNVLRGSNGRKNKDNAQGFQGAVCH